MKAILTEVFILISLSSFGQKDGFKVTILNCFSGVVYNCESNIVTVQMKTLSDSGRLEPYVYQDSLAAGDSFHFLDIIHAFFKVDGDKIFLDEDVMDGFNFKIFIKTGSRIKKIYVRNAYEARVDSLTTLFNKYFGKETWMRNYLISNGMGYWNNQELINELIRNQKSIKQLTEESRRFYLDQFCEF